MKAVIISIRPKWCELIASGKKTVEVRKTRPKIKTPFKCYIYCAKDGNDYNPNKNFWKMDSTGFNHLCNGKVLGEFVCDWCDPFEPTAKEYAELSLSSLVPTRELYEYSKYKTLCGWHISNLKIYDQPRELGEYTGLEKTRFGYAPYELKRPPQSWCYVEEVTE